MALTSEQKTLALKQAYEALQTEGKAVLALQDRLGDSFLRAIDLVLSLRGRLIFTGVGKSGIVARKIASTMASLGTASLFVHAVEAVHGDLGVIRDEDVTVVLSKSGETREILEFATILKERGVPVISVVGDMNSTLARLSDVALDVSVPREADHLNLAPTTSTTAALALGDALAVAVAALRNLTENDFALVHPAGSLGRQLLLRVDQLMHTGEENPVVTLRDTMETALFTVTRKSLGAVSVVDDSQKLVGIITDGDIRRLLGRSLEFTVRQLYAMSVESVMTRNPKYVTEGVRASDALQLMEDRKITVLPVVNADHQPVGMIHIHDLITAGIEGAREFIMRTRGGD
ncbi:MAG: KpsF/GutQ family sugar-phosphate isomerase [bacterium JZ-2024 1]